jgi:hypothetical protein
VVLLSANAGFTQKDISWHSDPSFAERSRGNLMHRQAAYPFYLLDPKIEKTLYWAKRLNSLIERLGESGLKLAANNVFCVEFFPYHSKKFRHGKLRLPSQDYSFGLVRQAIEHDAIILVLRCRKLWFAAVPELECYPHRYIANSWQNSVVSKGNFGDGFEMAAKAILSRHGSSG